MIAPAWVPLALLIIANGEVEQAGVAPWYPSVCAQIQVESAWQPCVTSWAGAEGLCQFMPLTWNEVSEQTEPSCAGVDRCDPGCAVRGQITYLKSLWGSSTCQLFVDSSDKWECTWRAYNGGLTWIRRMQAKCRTIFGCDPTRWDHGLSKIKLRRASSDRENTLYPEKIRKALLGYVE